MTTRRGNRIIAMLVAFCLCFSMVPLAFAEEVNNQVEDTLVGDVMISPDAEGAEEDEREIMASPSPDNEDTSDEPDTSGLGPVSGTGSDGVASGSDLEGDSGRKIASVQEQEALLENALDVEADELETLATNTSVLEPGTYLIQSRLTYARVLDVEGASKANRANVRNWHSNMSNAQRFKVTIDKKGYYTFTNVNSGLVLDVSGGSKRAGTNVWQYKANGSVSQKWIVTKASGGYVTIQSALKKDLVLDIAGASSKEGANLQVYTANGSRAQQFRFISTKPNVTSQGRVVANGIYTIGTDLAKSMVLDIAGGSYSNGARVQIYKSNNTLAQMFRITYGSDGFYTIRPAHSGKIFDVEKANLVAGTPIQQYKVNNTPAQKWAIEDNGDGTYRFTSVGTGLCLNVSGSKTANGTQIQTHLRSNSKAQRFTLVPVKSLIKEGTYNLYSRLSTSYVLDVSGSSLKSGANIQMWTANDTPAQKFYFKRTGDNEYTIHCLASGKYLATDGTNVVQKTKDDSSAQTWIASLSSKGGITFTNKASGKVLDVSGGKVSKGANIQQYAANKTAAQAFIVARTPILTSGMYIIQNVVANKVLDVKGGSKSKGANVQIYKSNNTNAQKWNITGAGGGYSTIKNVNSGQVLDIKDGSAKAGANVRQWSSNKSAAQKWKIVYNGDGTYSLVSGLGTALNVASGAATDGNNVNTYTSNGTKSQKFRMIPTTKTQVDYQDKIASFSTVSTNTANGTFNMMRALRMFDGVVIKPGQTISFFGVAGPCGAAQGFRLAGVVGGSGYGGGICQASTTLYGASIRAGLGIVQRRNHSVPSTYVPIGLDAMVDYGSSDLKIKNNHDFPIKIKVKCSGNTLTCEMWGIQPGWYDYIAAESWSTGGGGASAQRVWIKSGKRIKTERLPNSYY